MILGNVFPDLEIRMSEHALKVSCGPQPIALVPFGQLPHELAVLYVHWKYFIDKKNTLALFQILDEVLGLKEEGS